MSLSRGILPSVLALVLLHPAVASSSAPSHDHVADALDIGPGLVHLSTTSSVGATMEPGEPAPCGMGASVWFKSVVSLSSIATVASDTEGSDFDTVLAVYKWNPLTNGLTFIGCNDDSPFRSTPTSRVSFTGIPGEVYYFQVGGKGGDSGAVTFTVY